MEAATLNVTLLGGASFSANSAIVRSDLGPAGRLLACYLFEFTSRVHRRERLADLFWGDTDPDKARSALNTAIWRIRKILELGSKGAARHLFVANPEEAFEVVSHTLQFFSGKHTAGIRRAENTQEERPGRASSEGTQLRPLKQRHPPLSI
jgi:DNA-binding SARP family transcriptional activator